MNILSGSWSRTGCLSRWGDLPVEIESLTSQVLRETSLWNLQIHQARQYEDNCETMKYDDNHNNGEIDDNSNEEKKYTDETADEPCIVLNKK